MKITALLVDDENKALATLKSKIERFCPNILVLGEVNNPDDAIDKIKDLKPQLVFLDIAMPEMSGFDLLRQIENPDFEIIFVTAFDNYAIEAINHCAIGYLVKPVDNQDLIAAVNKAIQNIEDKTAFDKNKQLIENLGVHSFQNKKIVIPSEEGLVFVKIDNIIHCEGVDGYTKVHTAKSKPILSSNSIGHFSKLLQQKGFYLVHKSHLINLSYIEKYLNEGTICLSNGSGVSVARNKRKEFLEYLRSDG